MDTRVCGLPRSLTGKEFTCQLGDTGSIPGLGRAPGERNGYPLQYSCLGNFKGRAAWWATIHGVTKSQTQLIDSTTATYVYVQLTHFAVYLKLTEQCKSTILQQKVLKNKLMGSN